MLRAACFTSLVLVCTLTACASTTLPGTQLGTFKVTGQSTTNTCGLGAPNPWTFDVQLSQQGSTVFWSWMDGSAPLSGRNPPSRQFFPADSTPNPPANIGR